MDKITVPIVAEKFNSYPDFIKKKMLDLRQLILDTADELEDVSGLKETLKWGEPSYHSKIGSPLRIDWKDRSPDHYAMYFNCNTSLVGTFRIIYEDKFDYEGNRAIVFDKDKKILLKELKHCITLALRYKKVRHLPLLGE